LESASKLYTFLDHMSTPHFTNCRLHLPCIVFPVTELTQRLIEHMETCFMYKVKADRLRDLKITTKRKLSMFSRGGPVGSSPFLIVRPWDRRLFEVPDYADNTESMGDNDFSLLLESPGEQGLIDSELSDHAMRLIVRLGQPFHAFLLAKQHSIAYKRVAPDHDIIAEIDKDMDSIHGMMDIRTLEIL
jgi:hypothetical protein